MNFHFDKISINESDYILKDTKAEILIENGLNIEPEEYKNLIEKIFFNELTNAIICFTNSMIMKNEIN